MASDKTFHSQKKLNLICAFDSLLSINAANPGNGQNQICPWRTLLLVTRSSQFDDDRE
jgi:hypothetical protein